MKNFVTALCASALALAPVAGSAQVIHMPGGMGGWSQHVPQGGGGGGFPGGMGGGIHRGHGFGNFRNGGPIFSNRHGERDFGRWRHRGRGDACDIMGYGYGYGCVSIADLPFLIFALNDEVYCYDQHSYGRPRAIVCPDDWYDY